MVCFCITECANPEAITGILSKEKEPTSATTESVDSLSINHAGSRISFICIIAAKLSSVIFRKPVIGMFPSFLAKKKNPPQRRLNQWIPYQLIMLVAGLEPARSCPREIWIRNGLYRLFSVALSIPAQKGTGTNRMGGLRRIHLHFMGKCDKPQASRLPR